MAAARRVTGLVLIWSADGGLVSDLISVAKKIARVDDCDLCAITHGTTRERPEWIACRAQIPVPVEGLHRDEVPAELAPLARALPCVIARTGAEPVLLLDPAALRRCDRDPAKMLAAIRARTAELGLSLE